MTPGRVYSPEFVEKGILRSPGALGRTQLFKYAFRIHLFNKVYVVERLAFLVGPREQWTDEEGKPLVDTLFDIDLIKEMDPKGVLEELGPT